VSPAPRNIGRRPPGHPDGRLPQNAPASADESPSRLSPSLTVAPSARVTPGAAAYDIGDLPADIAARIKVNPATGCWEWTGPVDRDGYGKLGGRNTHRIIWEILVGAVPPKLVLDHREDRGCATKACGWPAHLLPVTNRENCTRNGLTGVAAINVRKDRCGRCNSEYDLLNTYYKPGGGRDCRRCIARRVREYRKRHPEAVRETRRRRRRRLAQAAASEAPELRRAA
jgi:hypothetical protein